MVERGGFGDLSFESTLIIALVSGSEFINHTYLVLLPPILALLAEDFQVSLALLGVAIGARGMATVLFQLPFGYVSDRHDRALGLWFSLGLGGVGTLIAAVAPSFLVLVVSQILIGIGSAGHHPSHFPLLSEAVPERSRARVFSVRGFTGTLGFAAPPAVILAVLSLPDTSWRYAFGILGVLGLGYGLLAFVLLRFYVSDEVKKPGPHEGFDLPSSISVSERIQGEVRSLASMPAVLALGGLMVIVMIVGSGFRTYVVVHLTDGYGVELVAANIALTVMFVVGAVMRLGGGVLADRIPAGTVVLTAYALLGALLIMLASLLIPAVIAMGIAVAVGGVRSASAPAREKLVDRFASSGALGQGFAVMTIGMMVGGTLGPMIFGILIENAGLRVVFLTMAALSLLAMVAMILIIVRYDDQFSFSRPMQTHVD